MKKKVAIQFKELKQFFGINPVKLKKELLKKGIQCIDIDNKLYISKILEISRIYKLFKFNPKLLSSLKYACLLDERILEFKKIKKKTIVKWKNKIKLELLSNKIFFLLAKPDLILSMHGLYPSSATEICAARDNKIKIILLENTLFKNKIIHTNNDNFTKVYKKFKINKKVGKFYLNQKKSDQHKSPNKGINQKNYILFLGQIFTDSNVIFGLKKWRSPLQILHKLVNWCTQNKYKLIIKLHPKESKLVDFLNRPYKYLTYQKIKEDKFLFESIKENKFIIDYKNKYSTIKLIKNSAACVTLNSQSALEAAIFNKKIVICGKNYFTNSKYFNQAFDPKHFNKVMSKAIKIKKKKISDTFLSSIYEYFCDKNVKKISSLIHDYLG